MKNAKSKMRTWIPIMLVAFLFNQSIMVFSQEYEMPSFVHAIDACDMDLDGSNDIIVSCAYADTIVILFNDGSGNFDPYYYKRATWHLLCGCIDEDSLPDILTVTDNLNYIKNNGNRTFSNSLVPLIENVNFPIDKVMDMSDDGWNDIIYACDTYWGIFKNNGDLTFTNIIIGSDNATNPRPSIGFFNNDPLPDIVISYSYLNGSQVTKYLINNGTFLFTSFILNETVYKSLSSHLDDIPPDDLILFYNPTPEVHLYENTGDATFISRGIHYTQNSAGVIFADLADYNQDGFDDFSYTQCFWSGCTDSLYVELNDHNWSFEPEQQYFIGTLNSFIINSIDLNGDNFPDFYMTGYSSNIKVKILWNNGDGTFSYENPVGIKESVPLQDLYFNIMPNPFSSSTYINFTIHDAEVVSLRIIDIQGNIINNLMNDKNIEKGDYQIKWDGTNNSGILISPGVYLIVFTINENIFSKKIIYY